jgi:hypothetical protein
MRATKNIEPVSAPPPEVTVAQPAKRQVTEFYEYVGRTKAARSSQEVPLVTGYLTKVHFSDGQEVEGWGPVVRNRQSSLSVRCAAYCAGPPATSRGPTQAAPTSSGAK